MYRFSSLCKWHILTGTQTYFWRNSGSTLAAFVQELLLWSSPPPASFTLSLCNMPVFTVNKLSPGCPCNGSQALGLFTCKWIYWSYQTTITQNYKFLYKDVSFYALASLSANLDFSNLCMQDIHYKWHATISLTCKHAHSDWTSLYNK